MRFGAFVMTFRRPEHLRRTLHTLLAQTRPPDMILVVDNAGDAQTCAVTQDFPANRVSYAPQADNRGPAGGAAYGLQTLGAVGYDWIYWGDDDDPPLTEDTLARLTAIAEHAADTPEVAVVSAVGHLFDWQRGVIVRRDDAALMGILDIDVFAGGTHPIVRGDTVRTVGVPDPALFFGFEEAEYSLRLRRQGYRLLVDGELMRQYREQTGRLGYKRPMVAALPAEIQQIWRQYYTTRNYIYCMAHRFGRPDLARRQTLRALAKSNLGWQKGLAYGRVYQAMHLRGLWDGWRGRMGRTVMPQAKYGE